MIKTIAVIKMIAMIKMIYKIICLPCGIDFSLLLRKFRSLKAEKRYIKIKYLNKARRVKI